MRLTLLTIGSRRDVQPMMALGENIVKHVRAIRAISHKLVRTEGYWESLYDASHQAEAIIYHYTASSQQSRPAWSQPVLFLTPSGQANRNPAPPSIVSPTWFVNSCLTAG